MEGHKQETRLHVARIKDYISELLYIQMGAGLLFKGGVAFSLL